MTTQYLMIQNKGECPVEGFTTLGLSTARGNEAAIGQFGSGNKHAVLLLMRLGINPIIYSGTMGIQFYSEPAMMGDKSYNKVFCKVGKKTIELSVALEYGEIDWQSTDMALREFISNALDASDGDASQVKLEITDKPRPYTGHTRVFVPLTPEVQRYYSQSHVNFLHFTGKQGLRILSKQKEGRARIYRKGVFVREIAYGPNSLFDYNFGEELSIDEARNLDDYACNCAAVQVLCQDKDALKKVFMSMKERQATWESGFSGYYLEASIEDNKETVKEAWTECFGDKLAIDDGNTIVANLAANKGFECVSLPVHWYGKMHNIVPTVITSGVVNDKGHEIIPATNNALQTMREVWGWIKELNLTAEKEMPEVKCFKSVMDAGCKLNGYVKNDVVYIDTNADTNKKVMLEELAHYITGSTDNSRDFQDWAFRYATEISEIVFN